MKYIALDIGNVLCHCDFKPFLNKLSKSLNITLEDAQYFMNRSQKLHDLGFTVMSDELRDHFKIKSSVIIEELLEAWNNSITPNYDILDRLNELGNIDGLQVALLSNIGLEHAALMEKHLSHNFFFENAIKHFSCFVGARKPSLIYYQSFLLQYPEFKGCVYLDDLQMNIDASQKFGFQGVKFALDDYIFKTNLANREAKFHGDFDKIQELVLAAKK